MDRVHDIIRVVRDIRPCESDNSPSVEQRLAVSFSIPGERIRQIVPSSRIPFDRKTFSGKGSIEPSVRIPRDRVLESRLRQAADSQDVGTPPFERRSVAGTWLPVVEDRPDLLDSRLAAPSHLINDPFHGIDLYPLIGDHRLKDGSRVPPGQERCQIHDRSRHRCHREASDFFYVLIPKVVAPMNHNPWEEVRCAGVHQHRRQATTQFGELVKLRSRVM